MVVVFVLLFGLVILPGAWLLVRHIRNRLAGDMAATSPEERALAEERSTALLRELLSEHECQQLTQHGYLDVASPSRASRVYRIPYFAGRVRIYEQGHPVAELCVQSSVPLPTKDVIVMHKLMIEANEQGYLARANEIPFLLPWQFYE
ncbi:MAG TPA: hypothetical protein VJQ45_06220 [Ktedonobacterales bacterium]|nr:hypothetical protein [Ktedonobacterales bacterium]